MITVSYNSEKTIKSTLDSVRAQKYNDVEYIIVDGGSTDSTVSIVEQHLGLVSGFISEPDKGIYDAMNKGVAIATGDIIGILNSDDFFVHENVLSQVVDIFDSNKDVDAVFGNVDFVDSADLSKIVRSYRADSFKCWMLRFGVMPPHPAIFLRRSVYSMVGEYDLSYKIGADFDFIVRMLLVKNVKYIIANKNWVRMRTGGVSTSGLKSHIVSTREMRLSLYKNGIYTNGFMLLFRLPFKYITQVLFKAYS